MFKIFPEKKPTEQLPEIPEIKLPTFLEKLENSFFGRILRLLNEIINKIGDPRIISVFFEEIKKLPQEKLMELYTELSSLILTTQESLKEFFDKKIASLIPDSLRENLYKAMLAKGEEGFIRLEYAIVLLFIIGLLLLAGGVVVFANFGIGRVHELQKIIEVFEKFTGQK